MDSVAGGDFLDLVDAGLGDEASPLGKGSKRRSRARAMPSRRHPWTTLGNGWRFRMPLKSGAKVIPPVIWPSPPKKILAFRHLCAGRQVLWVASIADDCAGCDAA